MARMSPLQSGSWQPPVLGEVNELLYFFLKPPSKAPTVGLADTMPTFFSSGLEPSADCGAAVGS